MKSNLPLKRILVEVICLLYVLLFVYAAVSKLLDFENFQVQLGQSPLISSFAGWVSWIVPLSELFIAGLLLFPRSRYVGLLMSYSLLFQFTVYIVLILNYSSFVPCSCGGILSDLTWNQHFYFNLCFVVFGALGILLQGRCSLSKTVFRLFVIGICSTLFLIALYALSEESIHRNNAFLRRYPHHPVGELKGMSLDYNSYYIAGFSKNFIYLGNRSAPLHVLSIPYSLRGSEHIRIGLSSSKSYSFSSVQLRVVGRFFYLSDGSIPVIYRGSILDWHAHILLPPTARPFSLLATIDSSTFVVRAPDLHNGRHSLGLFHSSSFPHSVYFPSILHSTGDGIFDTDGLLLYNYSLNKIIYSYYYRNSFLVSGTDFKSMSFGKTIDTLTQVPFEFVTTSSEKKFAKAPEVLQQFAATSGRYLFIKSNRLGRYEPESMLSNASIIDVYDLLENTYAFSFYFYHYQNEPILSFAVHDNFIVGLTKNHLVVGRLKAEVFKLK